MAMMPYGWPAVAAGHRTCRLLAPHWRIVDALTRWPSLSSSPWILQYPQLLFSVASRSI
jgi:hypothetical protein